MTAYNNTPQADWTSGESWSLGDSPSVAVVLDPNCGRYTYREAPSYMNDDTSCAFESGSERRVRVYDYVDSRYVLEDFFSKLELIYGA